MSTAIVIGSGFSSLSAASHLAKQGYKVQLFEKNSTVGGRCRQLIKNGYTFDIGPSWYWMPDIFDKYFADFGKKTSDYYELDRLNPGYKIYFQNQQELTIGDSVEKIAEEFERIEKGSGAKLRKLLKKSAKNYDIAINKIVLRPGLSPFELVTTETAVRVGQFFKSIQQIVRKDFKNPMLVAALEFPVLFLGAKPSQTPSFYSFMNYADYGLGTWHPRGGMYEIIKAMKALAEELGVEIHTDAAVTKINVDANAKATGVEINGSQNYTAEHIISGADYAHSETLLDSKYRQYSEAYWEKKVFAPSSLLFYVGFKTKIKGVEHHNLFFDTDFDVHSKAIYDTKEWPEDPLFYVNFPSVTDPSMAPENCETGFFLIPIAPGIEDTEKLRNHYFELILKRLEKRVDQELQSQIDFVESFCVKDFIEQYNSYKGNAYGLANTLSQTAFLRPKLISKKVDNLYFTGQLTVPGPGVPPSLISGKLVAELIRKKN